MSLTPDMILNPNFKPTNNISKLMNELKSHSEKEVEKIKKNNIENGVINISSVMEGVETFQNSIVSFYIMGLRDYEATLNTPQKMIQEEWNPSKCPNCETYFNDYEEVDDGYYKRATSMTRCPFCGQKIEW